MSLEESRAKVNHGILKPGFEMTTREQRIAKLEQQLAREKKQLQQQQRKKETRQKIILGGALLELAKKDENTKRFTEQIKATLKRDADRAAFDFPALKKDQDQSLI